MTRRYLPEDHHRLGQLNRAFGTWGATGVLQSSSDSVSPYRLSLDVPISVEEGDALVASLATDRAESSDEGSGPELEGPAMALGFQGDQ